jgi:hypothetical protein
LRKLFIIGNGFDLAHGLPTKYQDFHEYLKENYNSDDDFDYTIPSSQIYPDGEEVFDDNEVVKFLRNAISQTEGYDWWNLEHTLGVMDYDQFLDDYDFYDDDNDDENPWHEVYRNEDKSSDVAKSMEHINVFFEEWINSIDVERAYANKDFENLIDIENDMFLTFNYTKSLQDLYYVENVCHIHGKQGSKIYFGHGNTTDYTEKYMSNHIGSENYLTQLDDALRKNTMEALAGNNVFFEQITPDVKHVFSYGFSYSEVDMIYIRDIVRRMDSENVVWNLYKRNNEVKTIEELERIKKKILNCGFKGEVKTFDFS